MLMSLFELSHNTRTRTQFPSYEIQQNDKIRFSYKSPKNTQLNTKMFLSKKRLLLKMNSTLELTLFLFF